MSKGMVTWTKASSISKAALPYLHEDGRPVPLQEGSDLAKAAREGKDLVADDVADPAHRVLDAFHSYHDPIFPDPYVDDAVPGVQESDGFLCEAFPQGTLQFGFRGPKEFHGSILA